MIQDAAGKAVSYAAERLAVVDHFLKVLVQAGLLDTDLLAEYRAGHGKWSWRSSNYSAAFRKDLWTFIRKPFRYRTGMNIAARCTSFIRS